MKQPLLIEIGVEELPAIPFLKEYPKIKEKWHKVLKENNLSCDFDFYYTPRRLVLLHKEFPLRQDDSFEEFFGAPKEIAFKDGVPTQAAIGFAKKCAISVEDIKTTQKGKKEVLYYKKDLKGKDSKDLLEQMIQEFIKSLHFGKSMRWGSLKENFIRPIRWLGVLLGDEVVDVKLFGVKSSNFSYPHRSLGFEPFEYKNSNDYLQKLSHNGVMLDQTSRKKLILDQFKEIESSNDLSIEIDKDLLNEVVAITENPHSLIGEFDKDFLKLPPEVIVLSMKEHQRYFPLYKDNSLTNKFLVVSNSICDDYQKVISGNEKVLRARLSDALFFYENDLKNGLDSKGLENINFIQGGGSLLEKTQREKDIALYLADRFNLNLKDESIKRVFELSKADLLSDMVYEFTELQGLMGYYYAKEANEDEDIALAIKEQYLPDGEDSQLPSSSLSSITAMSIKLDTLLKLFDLGHIPTGTKDPFALRRAVIGVLKIALENGYHFDFIEDIKNLSKHYPNLDAKRVSDFIIERIYQFFPQNPSLIKSILVTGESDIVEFDKKLNALTKITQEGDLKEISTTFKRVANIIKDMDITKEHKVDDNLLENQYEKDLYQEFSNIKSKEYSSYDSYLKSLFSLKPYIDKFFDKVMVNVDDEDLKSNRKALICNIYKSFRDIADIKEITV